MNPSVVAFAAVVTITVGVLVVVVPLWIRGGRDELWAARGWVVPLLAAVVAMTALLTLAIARGGLALVTVGLGVASAGFAAFVLLRPARLALGHSLWIRGAMTGILVLSIAIVLVELTVAAR